MRSELLVRSFFLFFCLTQIAFSQNYPDQQYVMRIDSLFHAIETNDGLTLSDDGSCLMLQQDRTDGSAILRAQSSQHPFNLGLPSWNGTAADSTSSFKIQMRFPDGTSWSPWLTIGYWKSHLWSTYGSTGYAGGYIDIDNVRLYSYVSSWQFKILMKRTTLETPSPTLHKLSFFLSDSATTTAQDFTQIVNDNPAAVFIPTDFIYQYAVDPQIGGSICSPTSVCMILRSYDISVDPLQFARDTYDPYFGMFGIWPRVVQNAAEYHLDGAVVRYRSWSQAREVLASGGRIAMSVGPPLYSGHLMMLAGFTGAGIPIVHDPARSNGYSYVYNKSDLSHSWFDKGGVAYTFSPAGTGEVSVEPPSNREKIAEGFRLYQNYPNPFNPKTVISYQLSAVSEVRLVIYDLLGREVALLVNEQQPAGSYNVTFDAGRLASGTYLYRIIAGQFVQTRRMVLLR
jgi:hypothetical protein